MTVDEADPTLLKTPIELTEWEFSRTADGQVLADWAPITVPHAALRASGDVRAGGVGRYRTVVHVAQVFGDEVLRFDGVSVACRVRVNGIECGEHDGPWDPFDVSVGTALSPGNNLVEVDVWLPDYDRTSPFEFRSVLLGFVPDTMGPFAGIWRGVRLDRARPLRDARATGERTGVLARWSPAEGRLTIEVAHDGVILATTTVDAAAGSARVPVVGGPLWSPHDPTLVTVALAFESDGGVRDRWVGSVGLRDVGIDGSWIAVNDERVHLRGILHWGHYPDRGAPNPTREEARAEIALFRSLGFTAIKFCLWMPPTSYLELCDELGMLVWQELPLWLPREGSQVEARVRAQYPRLLDGIDAHPSVVIVSLGCELDASVSTTLLNDAYELTRSRLPGTVICANSGSGECFGGGEDARTDIDDYHFYTDVHHLEPLLDRFTTARRANRPWVFGEYNDADTWRDAREVAVSPDADWLSDDLAVNPLRSVHAGFASDQPTYHQDSIVEDEGFAAELPGLRELSEREAWAQRKLTFELTRRFEVVTGYVLTVLADVPVTTSGLIDERGRLKVDAEAIRTINADTVLSLASPLGRRWVHGGDRLEVADPFNVEAGREMAFAIIAGNASARSGPARVEVSLDLDGTTILSEVRHVDLVAWASREIISVRTVLPAAVQHSVAATMTARMICEDETIASNRWTVLIHPAPVEEEFLLLDPSERLAGWTAAGLRHITARELPSAARTCRRLVVTRYDDDVRAIVAAHGMTAFALHDGTFIPGMRGPFWRENVKRVARGDWIDTALPHEHVGEWGGALASDVFLRRSDIRAIVPHARSLVTRYDARTYRVGEYAVEWADGESRTVYSTLAHGGGLGTQPRSVNDNVLGRRLIHAFLDTHPDSGAMSRR